MQALLEMLDEQTASSGSSGWPPRLIPGEVQSASFRATRTDSQIRRVLGRAGQSGIRRSRSGLL